MLNDLQGASMFMSNADIPATGTSDAQTQIINLQSSDILPNVDKDLLLLEHVEECRIWIKKLSLYSNVNKEGFRKILKKYDKKHSNATALLASYYPSYVLTKKFSSFRETFEALQSKLDSVSEDLLQKVSGNGSKKKNTIEEIRKIWGDIYALQVRSILEKDDTEALLQITQSLEFSSLTTDSSSDSSPPIMSSPFMNNNTSAALPERTLRLLEREHALLLKYLLDGVCLHQSVNCLKLLLDSGLNVPYVERWMNMSLIYKIVTSLPQRPSACGTIEESEQSKAASSMIEILITNGSNYNWIDSRGQNSIFKAVLSGSPSCLGKLLGAKGIDFMNFDNDGCSPLFFAIQNGDVTVSMLLMDAAEEANKTFDIVINHSDEEPSMIPLIMACKNGHLDLVKALISRGNTNLNYSDNDGETALYHCAKRSFGPLVELLLENGADTNIREKYNQWTALFVAASNGNQSCVSLLTQYGADVDALDNDGWTPFEHSVFRGHLELARTIKPTKIPPNSSLQAPSKGPLSSLVRESLPREYGHVYLDRSMTLRLKLGHSNGSRSGKPIVEMLDRPVFGPLNIQLKISPSKPSFGLDYLYDLPIRGDQDAISFILTADGRSYYSPWDEIRFDLLRLNSQDNNPADVLGRGSIMLHQFIDEEGKLTSISSKSVVVPILDRYNLEPMALVSFEVLIACPFEHPNLALYSQCMYWKSVTTKVIGHRGLGANYSGVGTPQVRENTVLSFVLAASLGADYVEFDVQLTKDMVPVLYHDFIVSETGLDAPVSSLSLQQFIELRSKTEDWRPYHTRYSAADDMSSLFRGRPQSFSGVGRQPAQHLIRTSFATLREAFRKVPKGIGFNIEVKYPMADEVNEFKLQFLFEINSYCDKILNVIFEECGDRPIILSSFHPDIALLLSLKQPTFPVFFITEAGCTNWTSEPRASSLKQAIRFASEANLLGLVVNSATFVEAPRLIQKVKENGMLLFTYGKCNNEIDNVKKQMSLGVDAVIVDSVARIRRGLSGGT